MMFFDIALLSFAALSSALPVDEPISDFVTNGFNAIQGSTAGIQSGREPRKRGIAFNALTAPGVFNTPDSRCAWKYNWDSGTTDNDRFFEFVPMLWNFATDAVGRFPGNIDKLAGQTNGGRMNVLSFNEPDHCGDGGTCLKDVGAVIAAHKQWIQPLPGKYGDRIKIIAPSVTNGPASEGLDYLVRFLAGCTGCQIDYIALHWYDKATNIDYFKSYIQGAHDQFHKDIWITEFAASGSDDEIINFFNQVLPWLDSQDYVYRYAYQMAAPGGLLGADGLSLSAIGHVYNSL